MTSDNPFSPESSPRVRLLIGTKKGAFTLTSSPARATWTLSEPTFLGSMVHHYVADPRSPQTLLIAARTGHLGPTLFRSLDGGATWLEAVKPPAFPKVQAGGRVVKHTFWLTPGHASEPGVWYAGTSPQGLFRSEDSGNTWEGVTGFNDHPMRKAWCGGDQDGTPDGPMLHSINIDPRDPKHMLIGMSGGGVFESWDQGVDWKPLNRGCAADFNPEPDPEFGHDPHCMMMHPQNPDRLYQQNHCGIYRMDRPKQDQGEPRWIRIGDNMPREVGDIGFPIAAHPRNQDMIWVIPMDGTSVWPRTSPGGRPSVYHSRDAGESWVRQDQGLPSRGWLTVLRQALTHDRLDPLGLYFGTTTGEVWGSINEGASWQCLIQHLPQIYAVEHQEVVG